VEFTEFSFMSWQIFSSPKIAKILIWYKVFFRKLPDIEENLPLGDFVVDDSLTLK
jgi:hypothetical protein